MSGRVDLGSFDNSWYYPGRSLPIRIAWIVVSGVFMQGWLPWPSRWKCALLRAFGARVGSGVVIKPRVNVKYPWRLSIGDNAWVGEGVWLDSLGEINIGASACLSQGCMVETGNHDWTRASFDLLVSPVNIEDGAWAAVGSLLLPGSLLATHSVLAAGSVLAGSTDPYGVYVGVPAKRVKEREVGPK